MPCFGIFRPELEKTVLIFEISTFQLVKMQSFMLKGKKINLGPKLPYWGIFGMELEKSVIFEMSTLKFIKHEFL